MVNSIIAVWNAIESAIEYLRHILETNWTTLGPKVAHKINVYIGDMDSYFLNMGVRMLDEFLAQRAKDPPFAGEIVFQRDVDSPREMAFLVGGAAVRLGQLPPHVEDRHRSARGT